LTEAIHPPLDHLSLRQGKRFETFFVFGFGKSTSWNAIDTMSPRHLLTEIPDLDGACRRLLAITQKGRPKPPFGELGPSIKG